MSATNANANNQLTFQPEKVKLHYPILVPGTYESWEEASRKYHESQGERVWMEIDVDANIDTGVEAYVSWKSLLKADDKLSPVEQ